MFYKAAVPGHSQSDDLPTLRIIPLLTTADSKAHHEIGLTCAGGLRGCRRCTVRGHYVPELHHYYYGGFQYRFWNQSEPRRVDEDGRHGQAADAAATVAQRKQISKQMRVTGESVFYRLYDLCGFDPIKDLVIDAVHAIVLNLIRTELETHLMADLGSNASLPPTERDSKNGGLLDRNDLARALGNLQWTTELKDGRIPIVYQDGRKLGHWKAEEFEKFILVAPVVLCGLIPKKAYDCFCLLREIYNLVYSKRLRIMGWEEEHLIYFKNLLWLHAIQYEQLYGFAACNENVEYSLHMPEDVQRHSTMDNYWCYLFERQVKYYKQQSSNMKSLCKTFADRACQLHFVNTFLSSDENPDDDTTYNLDELSVDPVLLSASSVENAVQLKQFLCSHESLPENVNTCLKQGIMLGKPSYHLSERELADIRYWMRNVDKELQLPNACRTYSRILKPNDYDMAIVYRTGEHVIIRDAESEDKEWLVELSLLPMVPLKTNFTSSSMVHFMQQKSIVEVLKGTAGQISQKW